MLYFKDWIYCTCTCIYCYWKLKVKTQNYNKKPSKINPPQNSSNDSKFRRIFLIKSLEEGALNPISILSTNQTPSPGFSALNPGSAVNPDTILISWNIGWQKFCKFWANFAKFCQFYLKTEQKWNFPSMWPVHNREHGAIFWNRGILLAWLHTYLIFQFWFLTSEPPHCERIMRMHNMLLLSWMVVVKK